MQTKQEKRAGAIKRAIGYTYEKRKGVAEDKWEKNLKEHLAYIETLR